LENGKRKTPTSRDESYVTQRPLSRASGERVIELTTGSQATGNLFSSRDGLVLGTSRTGVTGTRTRSWFARPGE
jgi:hypothetical protein